MSLPPLPSPSLRQPRPDRYRRIPSFALTEVPPAQTCEEGERREGEGGEDGLGSEAGGLQGERNLERSLDLIGMGRYQYKLLFLCGFGWLCDNMYLCCLAIILPRVQDQFDVPSSQIGSLSASMMMGMMIGALAWGSSADLLGRTLPFNTTLALTGVFGLAASYAGSFGSLRIWVFLLGTAVGGSMPTDGTIFLENIPTRSQFLLTGLSVFFSIGAVISSILGLVIIPSASCPEPDPTTLEPRPCDVETENDGWRWLLRILGGLTLIMFLARLFLFRLHESPRYLATTNRHDQALHTLRAIASYNDHPISTSLTCDDVRTPVPSPTPSPIPRTNSDDYSPIRREDSPASSPSSSGGAGGYDATSDSSLPRPQYSFATPTKEQNVQFVANLQDSLDVVGDRFGGGREGSLGRGRPELVRAAGGGRVNSHSPINATGGVSEKRSEESWWRRARSWDWREGTLGEMGGKVGGLFGVKWRRTTVLIWITWGAMSLAYTMFNSFLPILLESRIDPSSSKGGRTEALEELLLYSLGGCPGALIGAYLIQTPHLNRRSTLAIFTVLTALSTLAFAAVSSKGGVIVSSMAISLAGSVMYSVLYAMTPEIFATEIRGTATGAASAVSRLTGITAPLLTGYLLSLSPSFPLYASAGSFLLAAGATIALPFERAEDAGGKSGAREDEEEFED